METNILANVWPEWRIEKQLGRGSFGTVYKAVRSDHNVESVAAVKVISIPSDKSEVDSLRSEGLDMNATRTYLQGIVDDFVSEIQLMESLKGCQNIVSVEDYKVVERENEIGWDIYIRMELLTPFNTYIQDKKLSESDVIKLGADICSALEICGKRNIIHRDIKPENIFVNDFGDFKLGDFGIARKMENVTGGLSQKGTFNYMAPEVANSGEYDARVDTYSLGIVLYRFCNENRLPFLDSEQQLMDPNKRRAAVERRIRGEALTPPCGASPAMADVILRACEFDPAKRFASATEMKQALIAVANGEYKPSDDMLDGTVSIRRAAQSTQSAQQPPQIGTFGSAPKKKSRGPLIALIAIALVIAIAAAATVFVVPLLTGSGEETEQTDARGDKDKDETDGETTGIAGVGDTTDPTGTTPADMAGITTEPVGGEDTDDVTTEPVGGADTDDDSRNMIVTVTAKLGQDYIDYMYDQNAAKPDFIIPQEDRVCLNAISTSITYSSDEQVSALRALIEACKNVGIDHMEDEQGLSLESLKNTYDSEFANDGTSRLFVWTYTINGVEPISGRAGTNYVKDGDVIVFTLTNIAPPDTDAPDTGSGGSDQPSQSTTNPNQNPTLPKTPEEHNINGGSTSANAASVLLEDVYHASYNSKNDGAWYKIRTSTNYSAYSFEFKNNSIDTTTYFVVYNMYEEELGRQSIGRGDTAYVDLMLEADTEYLIYVYRYNSDRTGNYQFSVKEKICDGGATKSMAFAIDLGATNTKAADARGINDWFKFTTTENYAVYRFTLVNNSINTTLTLTVFDEYDTELGSASASKGDTDTLDLRLTAGKEYTIRITRYYSDRLGYYQFTAAEMICDGGLEQSEAFVLPLGETRQVVADTTFPEWFMFTATTTGEYTLTLTNNNIDTSLSVTVFDILGTERGTISASKNDTKTGSLSVEAGTTLFLRITRYNNGRTGNYSVRITKN